MGGVVSLNGMRRRALANLYVSLFEESGVSLLVAARYTAPGILVTFGEMEFGNVLWSMVLPVISGACV